MLADYGLSGSLPLTSLPSANASVLFVRSVVVNKNSSSFFLLLLLLLLLLLRDR